MKFLPQILLFFFFTTQVFAQKILKQSLSPDILEAENKIGILQGPMPGHFSEAGESYWFVLDSIGLRGDKTTWPIYLADYFGENNKVEIEDWPLGKAYSDAFVRKVFVRYPEKQEPDSEKELDILIGSCAFQYQPPIFMGFWTRSIRNKIFEQLAKFNPDFMLWMGDNVYFIAGQYKSRKRMLREYLRSRKRKPIQQLMQAFPHYAIWDDHDFGPNNSGIDWKNKHISLDLFELMWINPEREEEEPGIYTKFRHADAEFFLIDSRYYADKAAGNSLGKKQMAWLKRSLKASDARFKFLVTGSQVLSPDPRGENMVTHYPEERKELLDFVEQEAISGFLVLTGDRHYTELQKHERKDAYPLYEFTCSPLTSFLDPRPKSEVAERIDGSFLNMRNFGRIQLQGSGQNRSCLLQAYDSKGNLRWSYRIWARDLE